MQTRTRARSSATADPNLPSIPAAVQLIILDLIAAAHPEPDRVEYTIWPYKSTLAWLLSLRLVCKQWDQHIMQHPSCIRRCRLEALRNLSLQHDYAHYIVTTRCTKRERVKAVPRKVALRFEDSSSTTIAVPKSLTAAEKIGGLPSNTLMLVSAFHQLTVTAFQQLLADIDCLDQHHSAPMVLKVTTAACQHSSSNTSSKLDSKHTLDKASNSIQTAAKGQAEAAAAVHTYNHASSPQQLIDAAVPLLRHTLQHVVMEGTATSAALYFIPTKQGFYRRVPMGR